MPEPVLLSDEQIAAVEREARVKLESGHEPPEYQPAAR
jgi:hypothetical protein